MPPVDLNALDADLMDAAMVLASNVLHRLTGRKYPGICLDTVRPVARWRQDAGLPRWWQAYGNTRSSSRYGWCSCNRSPDFGCASMPSIALPGYPVFEDDTHPIVVKVDGTPLSDGAFTVIDKRHLVRTDGQGWPCCQDLKKPDDEEGTWSVRYSFGAPIAEDAKLMAAMLGSNIYLSLSPVTAGESQLPAERIRSISRQGETITLLDPEALYKDGFTGVAVVDLWLMSERVGNERKGARVLVPGRGRQTRRRS